MSIQGEDEYDTPFGRLGIDNLLNVFEVFVRDGYGDKIIVSQREKVKRFILSEINMARIHELNKLYVEHNRHFEKDSCDLIKARIKELSTTEHDEEER